MAAHERDDTTAAAPQQQSAGATPTRAPARAEHATLDAGCDAQRDVHGDPEPAAVDNAPAGKAQRLLIVEDDAAFARTLQRSFERRGYEVRGVASPDELQPLLRTWSPSRAVVDLKLANGGSGLTCVQTLTAHDATMLIVVLTGFASIATAVEAIKLGASHYLAKPSNTDDIEAAFARVEGDATVSLTERPTSIKTLEWEHIHEVLAASDFNISEAARRLGMHRRTLARKLGKQRVK